MWIFAVSGIIIYLEMRFQVQAIEIKIVVGFYVEFVLFMIMGIFFIRIIEPNPYSKRTVNA